MTGEQKPIDFESAVKKHKAKKKLEGQAAALRAFRRTSEITDQIKAFGDPEFIDGLERSMRRTDINTDDLLY